MTEDENDKQPKLDKLISLSEAAEFSGLSVSFIRRLVGDGRIWGMKIGRNWITTEDAIKKYLAMDRRPGPKPKERRD